MKKPVRSKSPLKAKPLRNPGQSLDEHINDVIYDDGMLYAVMMLFVVIMAIIEWARWFSLADPSPVTMSALSLVVSVYCLWKIQKTKLK